MSAVAKLQAVLGMDASEFKAGMKGASKEASTFQSQIKQVGAVIAGAFSVGAIVSATKSIASWAGNVSEAAQNAGILTSEMMALNEVALKGGMGVDEMRRMLSKLQTELTDAAGGNEAARKKFESLGLSITDLAAMDPMSMFQAVTRAAFDSGVPLQHLADLFGDKLGPKAMAALRDLSENGLPAVGTAAADAADKIEDMGDRWDVMLEKIKRKTLEITMATIDGIEVSAAFLKGASQGTSKTANLLRVAGIVSPLAHVIGMAVSSKKGVQAAMATQGAQWAEKQQAKSEKDSQRKAAIDSNVSLSKQTDKTLAEKAYNDALEADAKLRGGRSGMSNFNKEIDGNYSDYFKRIGETSRAERSAGEKNARLQEQLQSLTATGPVQMSPDTMARVGGFFGGDRAGLDVQSKQLQVQQETRRIIEEVNQNIVELGETIRNMNGVGNG